MERIYTAAHLPDAYIVLNLLSAAGIDAKVFNENAQGGLGDIPFMHAYPEVWVLEQGDYSKAQHVIKNYFYQPLRSDNIHCPVCKEENPSHFEICWGCGADLGI